MTTIKIIILIIIVFNFAVGCGTRPVGPLVPVTNTEKLSAVTLAGQVSEDRLYSYVNNIFNISRYSWAEKDQALSSIEAEIAGLNYSFATQKFSSYEFEVRNLVLTKNGIITPNNWVVIMAHYDTLYDTPGADDNGSGCAALIEIAKILSNVTFESTLKLVFVDLEEWGMLGSKYFVSQIPAEINIVAAISLEMIGYSSAIQQNPFPAPFDVNTGDFLLVIGDGKSFSIANDFVRNLKQNNVFLPTIIFNPDDVINNPLFQDLMRSDNVAFWRYGYPAIMITDTANYRNPNYHQLTDSISTLDFTFLKKAAQAALISAYLWANPVSDQLLSPSNKILPF